MKKMTLTLILGVLLHLFLFNAYAQPPLPPRSVTVEATQPLSFGAFCLINSGSSGGTVTVGWDGSRSATGDVILLTGTETISPAIFEINLCPGRNISLTYAPTAILTGNHGGSVTLDTGPTEKGGTGDTFQVTTDCPFVTLLRVGGTLTIGPYAQNPGGSYSSNFTITFTQQ